MRRPFLVDEIILSSSAGEVRGQVHVDQHSATIEKIVCREYRFRSNATDEPVALSTHELRLATEIVSRALNADSDLSLDVGEVTLNGNAHSPPATVSRGQQVLADYLQSPREKQPAVTDPTAEIREPNASPSALQRIAKSG